MKTSIATTLAFAFALQAMTPAAAAQSALRFEGSGDFVDIGALPLHYDNTVEAWVKIDPDFKERDTQVLGTIDQPYCSDRGAGLRIIESGGLTSVWYQLALAGCGNDSVVSAPHPGTEWTHMAGTYDGQVARLYLNGDLAGESTIPAYTSATYALAGTFLWKGGLWPEFFEGELDELRFWGVARSQAEIRATMHTHLSGCEEDLIGYWRLDEGSGTIAENLGEGSQGSATVVGPTWIDSTAPTDPTFGLNFCEGSLNSGGLRAELRATGTSHIARNDMVLQLTGATPDSLCVVTFGPAAIDIPFVKGILCVGGGLSMLPAGQTDSLGEAFQQIDFDAAPADAIEPGITLHFQSYYRGGGKSVPFDVSNAATFRFCL